MARSIGLSRMLGAFDRRKRLDVERDRGACSFDHLVGTGE
jgi:hypothetical protein